MGSYTPSSLPFPLQFPFSLPAQWHTIVCLYVQTNMLQFAVTQKKKNGNHTKPFHGSPLKEVIVCQMQNYYLLIRKGMGEKMGRGTVEYTSMR